MLGILEQEDFVGGTYETHGGGIAFSGHIAEVRHDEETVTLILDWEAVQNHFRYSWRPWSAGDEVVLRKNGFHSIRGKGPSGLRGPFAVYEHKTGHERRFIGSIHRPRDRFRVTARKVEGLPDLQDRSSWPFPRLELSLEDLHLIETIPRYNRNTIAFLRTLDVIRQQGGYLWPREQHQLLRARLGTGGREQRNLLTRLLEQLKGTELFRL